MNEWIKEHIQTLSYLSKLTAAEAEALFLRVVRVKLDERVRGNRTYRLAYLYALNLLTRMFPYTQFEPLEDEPLLILPWGSNSPFPTDKTPQVTLVLGNSTLGESKQQIVTANCHNWSVYIGVPIEADPNESWNPVLALITACYAAARCTHAVLGDAVEGPEEWKSFSILDFENGNVEFDWSTRLELGEAHLAGIGAIGSSFLYSLAAHSCAEGKLVLVDHDRVEMPNLGRYTFFDASDEGAYKTIAAKGRLDKLGLPLHVGTVEERFEQYFNETYAASRDFRVEKLISAPDKRSTRRLFQRTLPRRMWDASTGPSQVILHSNSFEVGLACTECIYPETPEEHAYERHVAKSLNVDVARVQSGDTISEADAEKILERYPGHARELLIGKAFYSEFRNLCSAGELRVASGIVHAPFSFVSGLAGVLLYLELVKSSWPEVFGRFQKHNYFQLNPFRLPNPEFRELRPSRKECMCQQDRVRSVYRRVWSGGLSPSDGARKVALDGLLQNAAEARLYERDVRPEDGEDE